MGYCYSQSGSLCCDRCGKPGARKRQCPAGWCQPAALCRDCWNDPEVKQAWQTEWHKDCPKHSADFRAFLDRREKAEAAGLPWILAGVLLDNGNVFAWTAAGNYEVDRQTYQDTIASNYILDLDKAIPRTEDRP